MKIRSDIREDRPCPRRHLRRHLYRPQLKTTTLPSPPTPSNEANTALVCGQSTRQTAAHQSASPLKRRVRRRVKKTIGTTHSSTPASPSSKASITAMPIHRLERLVARSSILFDQVEGVITTSPAKVTSSGSADGRGVKGGDLSQLALRLHDMLVKEVANYAASDGAESSVLVRAQVLWGTRRRIPRPLATQASQKRRHRSSFRLDSSRCFKLAQRRLHECNAPLRTRRLPRGRMMGDFSLLQIA